MNWTDDQKKVIELRDRNILVSAAAGSGKTAVLVERILERITDEKNPIDIDRLVVVTFTKAAASEMRERIGEALKERVYRDPQNTRLHKQASLLSHAQISTIHSFCMGIIKNYFHTIELDPGFRMGDDGEMDLIKADVMEAVLEERYAKCVKDAWEADEFVNLVETFATGKSDKGLEEMVYRLYEKSMSNPWPEEWLLACKKAFQVETVRQMEETEWMRELMGAIRKSLLQIREWNREAVKVCRMPEGPDMQTEAMLDDKEWIDALLDAKEYSQMYEQIRDVKFTRLSSKRGGDPELRAKVSEWRKKVKKGIEDIKRKYFYQTPERMLQDIKDSKEAVLSLMDLTLEFMTRFKEEKEDKNLLDFNDLEHFALRILTRKKEDGELAYTAVANELMEHYEEIMIDEYQDGNLVQETILNSISKKRVGKPNLFMVGDVKQSIYRFRLARPELFMEKYNSYQLEDGLYQRIDLLKNFRSREVVLEAVNLLFGQIMRKELGGIEYNKEAALYPGRVSMETDLKISEHVDVLLVSEKRAMAKDGEDGGENTEKLNEDVGKAEDDDGADKVEKRQMEARVVGERIREMTSKENGLYINDEEGYRLTEHRDVVILLRSMTGWAETFTETLLSMGIPAYSDTKTGYFSTLEVQTVLNALKIMDNPLQDIPLAAVLRSPMGGFSNEELALVRAFHKSGELYAALHAYAKEGKEDWLREKTRNFLDWLDAYRKEVPYTKAYELIQRLYEETGYYYQVMAMPDGERRSGNLDMLMQKAVEYDATSYKGLFSFNRYMEKLDKFEVDFGEASVSEGSGNAVRIMSIHKSKGLEFPVVFVSGMGKRFNQRESREAFVIHSDLGVGSNRIDYEKRTKVPTILQRAIQNRIKEENFGEELRVLYVAMTRAKEKLILTGYLDKIDKALIKWKGSGGGYLDIMNGLTYFDWLIPPILKEEEKDWVCKPPFRCHVVTVPSEEESEEMDRRLLHKKKMELFGWDVNVTYDEKLHQEMVRRREYRYPYKGELSLPILVSVSDLKKRSVEEEESLNPIATWIWREEPTPGFMEGANVKRDVSMNQKGTVYHTVLQHLRFGEIEGMDGLEKEMERLIKECRMKEEELEWISLPNILSFLESDLGRRMRLADKQNALYKEKPFVIGLPAEEVDGGYKSREMVLVQGIIDAFFEEGEELVLVDYKTDEVRIGGEEELVKRYGVQLKLYQKALEGVRNKKVKEAMIYSFSLGKTICL